jgi:hypothetical protein
LGGAAGRRRRRLFWMLAALVAAALIAAAFLTREGASKYETRSAAERPELLLLTSLPIVFPERFALDAVPSPTFQALQRRYRVNLISVADDASLKGHRLLLMVQPRAQPAEMLVELDSWVRSGGKVLLLADPALQWPSDRPLGDPLRPPPAFADTGLLQHWGLSLAAPARLDAQTVSTGDQEVRTASPGTLHAIAGNCRTEGQFVARCAIGRGRVTVIADADFIDPHRFGEGNLQPLFAQLAALEQ